MAERKSVKAFKPAGYHVLVDMMEAKDTSTGGVYIGESVRNREQMAMTVGQIVSFGPGCFKNMSSGINSPEDWGVKVGDWIRFPSQCYTKTPTTENKSLVTILDHDIKGTVELEEDE
tara:strand:- start:3134 stop:3484 length:351 start_codon:yes stop_codon:yes gene_type:complete